MGSGSSRDGAVYSIIVREAMPVDMDIPRVILSPSKRSILAAENAYTIKKAPRSMSGVVKLRASAVAAAVGSPATSNRLINPVTQEVRVSAKMNWLLKGGDFGTLLRLDSFEMVKILGAGLMGVVRLAKMKEYGVYVALKSINKDIILRNNDVRHITNEREILYLMSSPFCVKLFGTFQDNKAIYFIMEYSVGGELFNLLPRRDVLNYDACKFYIMEIFCALEHVHTLGYVYRDLKPENIMIDEFGHCKLIDFGFAIRPNEEGLCRTSVGTSEYLSPELLNGKFTNGYTGQIDWWAFGCLLYELMTGFTPFTRRGEQKSKYEIYLSILKGNIKFTNQFDNKSRDLVMQLCHPEIDKRLIVMDQIKSHSYFDIDWRAVQERRILPPFVPRVNEPTDFNYFKKTYMVDGLGANGEPLEMADDARSPDRSLRVGVATENVNLFSGF